MDIAEKLRDSVKREVVMHQWLLEGADEIDRLRAEVASLKEERDSLEAELTQTYSSLSQLPYIS